MTNKPTDELTLKRITRSLATTLAARNPLNVLVGRPAFPLRYMRRTYTDC